MSSGGQNGTDISGVTTMRIQYASDVTEQLRKQRIYESTFSDPVRTQWHNFNPNGLYFDARLGRVECRDCSGVLPYFGPLKG
jgi:hypothetical protein